MENVAIAMNQMKGSAMRIVRNRGTRFIGKITAKKRSNPMAIMLSMDTVMETSLINGPALQRILPTVPATFHSYDMFFKYERIGEIAATEPAKSDEAMFAMR